MTGELALGAEYSETIPVDSVGQKTLIWSKDMCGH